MFYKFFSNVTLHTTDLLCNRLTAAIVIAHLRCENFCKEQV